MQFCTTHGREHYNGEVDHVATVGDNVPCRTEEWVVVEGTTVTSSLSEPLPKDPWMLVAGDLAYLDTMRALVPVKVLDVLDATCPEDEGQLYWEGPTAHVRVTANRPGYDRGEVIEVSVPNVWLVHRQQVRRRRGQLRIVGHTTYLTSGGDIL